MILFFLKVVIIYLCIFELQSTETVQKSHRHSNNWAVLVSTSRFWFNYRHMANTLGIYHICKQNGIPDSNIILLIADDIACNPRNVFPGQIFNGVAARRKNLYDEDIEMDYRGYEVTVDNFLRILTDRHEDVVSKHKRLKSDSNSNILIYLSGHGGDEFLKFQDNEEITAEDISNAIKQMEIKKRYNEMLIVLDTCQAATFFNKMDSKGVITAASSSLGESSYSHQNDFDVGVSVIDRFTHHTVEYFEKVTKNKNWWNNAKLQEMFESYNPSFLKAEPKFVTKFSNRDMKDVLLSDFFGSSIVIDTDFMQYSLERNKNDIGDDVNIEKDLHELERNILKEKEGNFIWVMKDVSTFIEKYKIIILTSIIVLFSITKFI